MYRYKCVVDFIYIEFVICVKLQYYFRIYKVMNKHAKILLQKLGAKEAGPQI